MSIEMDEAKEHFAVALLGRSRTSPCVGCNTPDLNFRDDLSKREYGISRFCQTCQDSVFGSDE